MNNAQTSSFSFEGFKILKSVFDRKEGELGKNFNIGFKPSGTFYKNESLFILNLGVQVINESNFLSIEIEASANFKIHDEIISDKLKNYLFINSTAILFPYIRAYISTLSTLSGLTPIILPTLNLTNIAEELEKNTTITDSKPE